LQQSRRQTLTCLPSSLLHRYCHLCQATVPGTSRRSTTPVGAIQVVEEALQVTLTVLEFWPNRLPVASSHHRPPPLEGKRNDLPTSLRCHRLKPCQKSRSEAPYTANSGEPPLWAGRATVRSAAPGRSHPKPSARRSALWIRSLRTPSIGLISALDPPTDDSHLMKSP
jgi:hypothetical protein